MNISAQNLDAIYYGFLLNFQGAYLNQPTYYQQFSQTLPSTGRENRYGWMDKLPRMREWVGERQLTNAALRGYTLVNRDWELTDELDRNTVLDDQYGIFASMNIPMMGMQSKLLPDQLLVDVLQNGDNTVNPIYQAWDGLSFFNTGHLTNFDTPTGTTFSNLFTGGGALSANYFQANRAAMINYVGADARPFGVYPSLMIVPAQIEVNARQILQQTFIAPAAAVGMNAANTVQGNPLVGMCNLLVHPYLANDATSWYLLDMTQVVKPFIFQLRQAPLFVFKNKPDDSNLFYRKKFVFGVDARAAAGYSLPYFAAKCKL